MKRTNFILAVAMCAVVALFTYGCVDPDPGGAFDEYTAIVGEEATGDDVLCASEERDLSGFYFVRLQHSVGPANHILMSFDVEETNGSYTIVVQPLKTDFDSKKEPREDARTPVGDAIVVEGLKQDENAELHIALTQLRVDGEANSFTWGDILADIDLVIAACEGDDSFICGTGDLNVFEPFPFPNETANFGGVRVDEITTDSVAPKGCNSDPE